MRSFGNMNRTLPSAALLATLTLAACNSSSVLDPAAVGASGQAGIATPSHAAPQPAIGNAASASVATLPARVGPVRLQVAPIVGTSLEAAGPLLQELQHRARQRGITLAGSSGQNPTQVLKGYFSVLNEEGGATVIYVWDIYDPAGSRLHRISGQQTGKPVNGAEGWPGVGPDTLKIIADNSMDQLATWLANTPVQK